MKLCLIFLMVLFASCNSGHLVKVVRNDVNPEVIVFDSQDTLLLRNKADSIVLRTGRHTFKWKGKTLAFDVAGKGGILNLDGNEFIKLEIRYEHEGEEPEYPMTAIPMSNFVVIDSFLICEKRFENEVATTAQRRQIVDSIKTRKNGNYAPLADAIGRRISDRYDTDDMLYGFKKIGRQNLFIEKSWDFDPDQKIPEQIAMRGKAEDAKYKREESKSCLMRAGDFFFFAKFHIHDYSVTDVRLLMRKNK